MHGNFEQGQTAYPVGYRLVNAEKRLYQLEDIRRGVRLDVPGMLLKYVVPVASKLNEMHRAGDYVVSLGKSVRTPLGETYEEYRRVISADALDLLLEA